MADFIPHSDPASPSHFDIVPVIKQKGLRPRLGKNIRAGLKNPKVRVERKRVSRVKKERLINRETL
jgi:hypothetical protein